MPPQWAETSAVGWRGHWVGFRGRAEASLMCLAPVTPLVMCVKIHVDVGRVCEEDKRMEKITFPVLSLILLRLAAKNTVS